MGTRMLVVLGRLGWPGLHPEPPRPTRRPLEVLARDLRRLRALERERPPGTSWCRVEAVRHAYAAALVECAESLEVSHLLAVLPPGAESDHERERLERALEARGVDLG